MTMPKALHPRDRHHRLTTRVEKKSGGVESPALKIIQMQQL